MRISYKYCLFFLALLPLTVGAFHYSQEPDRALYEYDIGPLPACDYIITASSHWKAINNPAYRVFCVAPGDYRSAGSIFITTSGTESKRKWIRYYNPGVSDTTHPYFFPEATKAITRGIDLTNASYWVIDRLTLDGSGLPYNSGSFLRGSSQYNVLNRLVIRKFGYGINIRDESNNNWIQNNVLYDQNKVDLAYIAISGSGSTDPKHTKIVNNECWDASDCVQLTSALSENVEDFRGTIIYNNDMYQTGARYTDCNGKYSISGPCSCSENAIDLKGASESASDPVIIAHNRLWGWRSSDKLACGDMSDAGNAIVDHFGIYNLRVEGNVFWDNSSDYLMGTSPVRNVAIEGNLFHAAGPAKPGLGPLGGLSLTGSPAAGVRVSGNTFSSIVRPYRGLQINASLSQDASFTFTNNVFIDNYDVYQVASGFKGKASGNEYYNSRVISWDTPARIEVTVKGSGYDKPFCTHIKRITNPMLRCFDNAFKGAAGSAIGPPGRLRVVD